MTVTGIVVYQKAVWFFMQHSRWSKSPHLGIMGFQPGKVGVILF